MGHRKHSAPRRGSLAYRPRGRAKSLLPRIRTWPKVDSPKPMLLAFPAFKAGTIHVITVDDRQRTPNSGKPLFNVASVLAVPDADVKGVRLYGRENGHDVALGEARADPQELMKKVPQERVSRVAAFVSTVPSQIGLSQNKPIEFEVGVGGGDPKAQVEFAAGLIGKKVRFAEIFKPGMRVDVLGITKGKGFEGPVTRFGVKRKQHKSRKSVRAVGVIGPWHPAAVMYTIARAGQKGFSQRAETGRRIITIANAKDSPITPAGGFLHYGEVKGDYAVLRGTVPGPASRFAVVRLSVRGSPLAAAAPQVLEISTNVGRAGK
ncbi:MAG TPA: 50S ribosomal protein L3 [Nitrososphaerales archaeon]|nr:50S ribosomal protein L3 [Nitrososphaerales archaeon]